MKKKKKFHQSHSDIDETYTDSQIKECVVNQVFSCLIYITITCQYFLTYEKWMRVEVKVSMKQRTTTISISIWLKISSSGKDLHIEINNY